MGDAPARLGWQYRTWRGRRSKGALLLGGIHVHWFPSLISEMPFQSGRRLPLYRPYGWGTLSWLLQRDSRLLVVTDNSLRRFQRRWEPDAAPGSGGHLFGLTTAYGEATGLHQVARHPRRWSPDSERLNRAWATSSKVLSSWEVSSRNLCASACDEPAQPRMHSHFSVGFRHHSVAMARQHGGQPANPIGTAT